MDAVKNILREELNYALDLQQHYEKILNSFPKGSLSYKKIKGKTYTYLQYRDGNRVVSRMPAVQEVESYRELFDKRNGYRQLLKEVKEKIKFIRKALSG